MDAAVHEKLGNLDRARARVRRLGWRKPAIVLALDESCRLDRTEVEPERSWDTFGRRVRSGRCRGCRPALRFPSASQ